MAHTDFSVLGSIYGAAIDETRWPEVLNSFAPIAGANSEIRLCGANLKHRDITT